MVESQRYYVQWFRVIDGDSVEVEITANGSIRLPFYSLPIMLGPIKHVVRILGIQAPELRDPGGPEAKEFLRNWLATSPPVFLATDGKRDKYGRLLGDFVAEDRAVSEAMLAAGHATVAPWKDEATL